MAISTVVTLGMSISGGLTAGTSTLSTIGYDISAVVSIPVSDRTAERRLKVTADSTRRVAVVPESQRRLLPTDPA